MGRKCWRPKNPKGVAEREMALRENYHRLVYEIEPAIANSRRTDPPRLLPSIEARVLEELYRWSLRIFGRVVAPTFKRVFKEELERTRSWRT